MNGPGLSRDQRRDFFREELLRSVPRLLSALDRCPVSASGGSLDREYWGWATKDFANLDLQRAARVLAYLHVHPFTGNFLCQQEANLAYIRQAVSFWLRGQDAGGGFNHLYPNESSWMAAAFTLVDMVDAYRLVGESLEPEFRQAWLAGMERAGWCLVGRDETHGFISNHRAGAAAGLLGLAQLSGQEAFRRRAWALMEEIYARQSPEGWFLEYEGADPGYQSLDTHYQAIFLEESGQDRRCLEATARSLEFLAYFLHPDGSLGGEYGSRACPHYFPGGLEVMARRLPLAESLASLAAWGLAQGHSCGLADSDPRNETPMATSYVLALQALEREPLWQGPAPLLPCQRACERLFPQAGLYARCHAGRYYVFGAAKGGVLKVYSQSPPGLLHASCGYAGRLKNGAAVTSLLWTSRPRVGAPGLEDGQEHEPAPSRQISVEAPFFHYRPDRLMRPWMLVLFRLFYLTLGRWRGLSDWVRRNLIIGRFLTGRRPAPLRLRRKLSLAEDGAWSLEDEIALEPGAELAELREHGFFSAVYMASARYFRRQDLAQTWSGPDLAGQFRQGRLNRASKG